MKFYSILITVVLLSSCNFNANEPDEKQIKINFEEAFPFLELRDIKKNNGVKMEINGVQAYQIFWDGKVYAKKDLTAYYERFGDSILKTDDDKEWQSYYKNSKSFGLMRKGGSYKAGQLISELKNKKTTYTKTDKGWIL